MPHKFKASYIPKIKSKRDKTTDRFYTSKAWRTLRKWHLSNNPYCAECERNNINTLAQMVDHIEPIEQGGEKLNEDNLQSMCNSCHAKKSAKERWSKNKE